MIKFRVLGILIIQFGRILLILTYSLGAYECEDLMQQ